MRTVLTLITLLSLFCPPSLAMAPAAVRLDISARHLDCAEFEEQGLWLKLTPEGVAYLHDVSAEHPDERVDVFVLDEPAIRATLWATIEAGNLNIASPSPALVQKITPYLR